jgi:hypothetical protein
MQMKETTYTNHSFDIDNKLCYYMINGKAKIEKPTNTLADSSASPRTDGNEPGHRIPLGVQRWIAYVSRPEPPPFGARRRADKISGEVVRALKNDSHQLPRVAKGVSTVTLEDAKLIAERVKATLSPHCERVEIAGSIRRGKATVHDIDLVMIPKPGEDLVLNSLLCGIGTIEVDGPRLKRLRLPKENISVDIYIATPATWATLLLIRTGSAESNVRLSSLAKRKGWHLKASGEGLFDEDGNRIAGDTEESIFEALGVQYQQPNERR